MGYRKGRDIWSTPALSGWWSPHPRPSPGWDIWYRNDECLFLRAIVRRKWVWYMCMLTTVSAIQKMFTWCTVVIFIKGKILSSLVSRFRLSCLTIFSAPSHKYIFERAEPWARLLDQVRIHGFMFAHFKKKKCFQLTYMSFRYPLRSILWFLDSSKIT